MYQEQMCYYNYKWITLDRKSEKIKAVTERNPCFHLGASPCATLITAYAFFGSLKRLSFHH